LWTDPFAAGTVACTDRRIHFGIRLNQNIWGVEIIFSRDPDQREQRISSGRSGRPPCGEVPRFR
jgi:hypothetical protein